MEKFKPFSLTVRGRLCNFRQPIVMGIVNITPDSFYGESRCRTADMVRTKVSRMCVAGASIIDVGAYSTRPGADDVSADEEIRRLEIAITAVKKECPDVIISVDTFRSAVARKSVLSLGADVINDVSGGTIDNRMFETIATLKVPYILMHMRGTPETMQQYTEYRDVTADVIADLQAKVSQLSAMGVADVIVDPGFGFAKTLDQNYELLRNLPLFQVLERPLLVGMSRKSMIFKLLGKSPDESLNGTTIANTIALLNGASILRVHDVDAAVDAIRIIEQTYPNFIK